MKYIGIRVTDCNKCKNKKTECMVYRGSWKKGVIKRYCLSCAKTPRGNQG